MNITKKELLVEMDISYGQLYRWKREHLIPEEWFIKQSSYTGQETVFPREKMLSRIQFIKEMKDKYSLEEIASMLGANENKSKLMIDKIRDKSCFDDVIIEVFLKEEYSYYQAALLYCMSDLHKNFDVSVTDIKYLLDGISGYFDSCEDKGLIYQVMKSDSTYFGFVCKNDSGVCFDNNVEGVNKYFIDDVIGNIKSDNGSKVNLDKENLSEDKSEIISEIASEDVSNNVSENINGNSSDKEEL